MLGVGSGSTIVFAVERLGINNLAAGSRMIYFFVCS